MGYRRNTELGLIAAGGGHHRRRLRAGQPRRRGRASRPTSSRSSASCSACCSAPTSPSGAWRPTPTRILLPIAGLLNGLGYVFIARLDEQARRRPAGQRGPPSASSPSSPRSASCAAPRDLERYRYTFALVGIGLLLLPLAARRRQDDQRRRIWVGVGPVNFQPGEFAKIVLAIFFAAYLVEKRELLAISTWKVGPLRLPDPKHLGPVLLAWGVSLVVMVFQKDLGSSLLFFALFVVMLWVATERATLPGRRRCACSPAAPCFAWTAVRATCRSASTSGSTRGRTRAASGYQIVQGLFALAFGGVTGTGLGLGGPTCASPPSRPTSSSPSSARSSACSAAALVIIAFLLMVGAGPAHRRRGPSTPSTSSSPPASPLLLGVQAFIIIAGVTRLLPAHRRHAAVRVLRRLVARRQLRAARPAAADLRPERARPRAGRADRRRWRREPQHPPPRHRHRRAATWRCS